MVHEETEGSARVATVGAKWVTATRKAVLRDRLILLSTEVVLVVAVVVLAPGAEEKHNHERLLEA